MRDATLIEYGIRYDDTILGWWMNDENKKEVVECSFFRHLVRLRGHTMSDERKAEFVVEAKHLIAAARASEGDEARLKPIADSVRRLIQEIPSQIPRGGFPNMEFEYPDSLTAAEIVGRIRKEVNRLHLEEWFESVNGGTML